MKYNLAVIGAGSAINGWDGKKWYKSEFGVNHVTINAPN
jgi:hypothetical protein